MDKTAKKLLEDLAGTRKRGVVAAFDQDGNTVEVEQAEEKEQAWPQGNAEPPAGWDPYYKGIWLIAELGLMRARSGCLLVKAVTGNVLESSILTGTTENATSALAYEVVDIADDFPIEMLYHAEHNPFGLRRGDHIVHLSASQDRLDSRDRNCPWFWVEAPDIAGSWRATTLREILADSKGKDFGELVEAARPFADLVRESAEAMLAKRWEEHLGQ